MKRKLSDMGPEVIRTVATLGRLDRLLILNIDPFITEEKLFETFKKITPVKARENVKIKGLWETSSGYAKALASVPCGVFSAVRRVKVGFFLCRIQISAPPTFPGAINATISDTLQSRVRVPISVAHVVVARGSTLLKIARRSQIDALHARGEAFPPSRISLASPNAVPG